MQKIEYTKMFELEDKHFWFIGKRYFVDSLLSKYKSKINKTLDLGSGTGGMTKHMEKYGKVIGIESYNYAIKLGKTRRLNIKKGDLNKFKVKNNSFDLVTIFDVLYHKNIKSEDDILHRVNRSLRKKGYLLITDSALDFLTSQHDIKVQGRRRYSLGDMEEIIENQGFKILKASYIYFSLFPIVALKRLIFDKLLGESESDVKSAPRIINNLLLAVLYIESILLKYITFPIGSSVILLAVKK